MQYVVTQTKQIAIEAETPEEAQKKVLNGEGTSISLTLGAQPRPKGVSTHQGIQGSNIQINKLPTTTTIHPTPAING